ncbi:hypothetical protein, partial [Streptomyces sp. NPDC059131]|uniref:hypothetical protein n=1 Tax=Streptomyces sp. NPDC059131 TaxID=3346736 RepID=UPI0036BACA55
MLTATGEGARTGQPGSEGLESEVLLAGAGAGAGPVAAAGGAGTARPTGTGAGATDTPSQASWT